MAFGKRKPQTVLAAFNAAQSTAEQTAWAMVMEWAGPGASLTQEMHEFVTDCYEGKYDYKTKPGAAVEFAARTFGRG